MNHKGIILAGGRGTRLYPSTTVVSKQLLPVYDKPMVYYPLSLLMLAGIREFLLISSPESLPLYRKLLGHGERFGIVMDYQVQEEPRGLPEAFILAEDFLNGAPSVLVLGDNLFFGDRLGAMLEEVLAKTHQGMHVFLYPVKDPESYGVIALDPETRKIQSLEEKPSQPKSNLAIPGLYVCDHQAPALAKTLKPSARGELEITDLMRLYLNQNRLQARELGRGVAWLDTGTPENMLDASEFVAVLEKRQGLKISCLEEIALHKGWLTRDQFNAVLRDIPSGSYKEYLKGL